MSPHALFTQLTLPGFRRADPEFYPRPNGEVYVCGLPDGDEKVPEGGPTYVHVEQHRCDKLIEMAGIVSLKLKNGEVEKRQSCYLPITEDGLPIMGQIPDFGGAYVCTGHGCWGILNRYSDSHKCSLSALAPPILTSVVKCSSLFVPMQSCKRRCYD